MGTYSGPLNSVDGLIYHIDPANPRSYSGVGTIIYDMSGNNNTSYFTNGAFYQNYQKGVVLVDGNNDYISTPVFNLTSPITVSAWVKNVADDAPVFSTSGVGVYGNGEVIHYFSGKSILIAGGGSPNKYFQFPQLNLNSWVHLTMTRDVSNNMRVYLNGIGSTSNPQSNPSILQINQIGRYSSFTNIYNLKGSIGEVKIYNRDLSAAEVLQNYNSTKKRYVPEENIVTNGLVLNVDASNSSSYVGSGNTVYDLSGSGNTGTLTNGPTFSELNGGSIVFDGSNDFLGAPSSSSLDILSNLSAVVWMKLITTNGANHIIFSKTNGTNPFLSNYEAYLKNDVIYWWDSPTERNTTVTLSLDSWTQIAFVRSSTSLLIYKNGSLSNTISVNQVGPVVGDFYIGQDPNGQLLNFNLAQFLLYSRALSAVEVEQNYNATKGRFGY
jgi:hypothetical protein